MKEEDVTILAQLLTAMKDALDKLESAYNRNKMEELASAKKAILNFQKKTDEVLK